MATSLPIEFHALQFIFLTEASSARMFLDDDTHATIMYSRRPGAVYDRIRHGMGVGRVGFWEPPVLPMKLPATQFMIPMEASSASMTRT